MCVEIDRKTISIKYYYYHYNLTHSKTSNKGTMLLLSLHVNGKTLRIFRRIKYNKISYATHTYIERVKFKWVHVHFFRTMRLEFLQT